MKCTDKGMLLCRWLVLDTDTRDLVSMHTDGNEIISNIKYSPGTREHLLL